MQQNIISNFFRPINTDIQIPDSEYAKTDVCIVMLLLENGYEIPSKRQKKAYLLEKNMHKEGILKVLEMAKADRAAGKQVLVVNMKKNKKFQKDQLIAEGYEDITDCYKDSVMDL